MINLSSPRDRIALLAEEGNLSYDACDFNCAIAKWKKALDGLPPPKLENDYYPWLTASIGDAFYMLGDHSQAKEYFMESLKYQGDREAVFVLYRIGQCMLHLGDERKSIEYFLQAYMLDGEEIFTKEPEGHDHLQRLRSAGLIS